MPSFRHDSDEALGQKLEELERLSESYTAALGALGRGEVEAARDQIQAADEIILSLTATDRPDSLPGAPSEDPTLTPRLQAKTKSVLDLHTRLLDELRSERDQVAREQKGLHQRKRHLESLQSGSRSGSILDSQA